MKKIFLSLLISISCITALAHHIVGGEMLYEYLGPGSAPNTKQYRITLKLFRDQNCVAPCAQMPADVWIGIYNRDNNIEYSACATLYCDVPKSDEQSVPVNPYPPCISNPPALDYHVGYYTFIVELPDNNTGYTAAYQTCCRVDNPNNVFNPSANNVAGSTYNCDIPSFPDNSPVFDTKIDVICQLKKFTLDFAATDKDGDSLAYSFSDAYNTSSPSTASANINPSAPPYNSLTYINGYTASQPLGSQASINPRTGIISGIAPSAGAYVVCVAARSYRNGVFIAEHRKDFIVNIGTCDFSGADPKCSSCSSIVTSSVSYYTSCNSFTTTFANGNNSPLNKTYFWDFGVSSQTNDTSTLANPTFTYPDTGVYVLTLIVNREQACFDSTTTQVRIYPGFFPGFISNGQCKNTQIQFTDTTKTNYGVVNSWTWDFGDPSTAVDTSHIKNPQYTYSTAGNYDMSFFVTNSKGCSATITKTITITDKPDLQVTNDTLICSIDTLQLNAIGNGTIFWIPNYNINDQNNPSPLVSPDVPTKYYITLTDPFGCKATDSVFVDVKLFVTIDAGRDTGICQGDAVQLNPISDALHYKWSPAALLDNDTSKNPIATPSVTTKFYVIGNIGKCQSTDSVTVRVAPYPGSLASADTILCFGNAIQLHASGGSMYTWSPSFFLNDPNIPDPIANPDRSIRYIVTIHDTLGCPKPVFDTVVVQVQRIIADAGPRDTSIVVNQPLQLNATGGQFYLWTPATGLNNPAIANPVATISDNIDYVVRVSTASGCFATDTISVKVYKVLPGIYVPSAFTPDGDGKNDVFRPIAIGIKQITYFKVFNRWGVLVYSSAKNAYEQSIGWDGTYKGKPQDSAVYVWIVEGVDYLDKKITQKGTVTLIR